MHPKGWEAGVSVPVSHLISFFFFGGICSATVCTAPEHTLVLYHRNCWISVERGYGHMGVH